MNLGVVKMENDKEHDAYESLKQSLIEMKEMRQGKRAKKTWQEFREELQKEELKKKMVKNE